MKLLMVSLRRSALLLITVLTIWVGVALGQEKSSAPNRSTIPAAKKSPDPQQTLPEVPASASEQAGVESKWEEEDSPELLRKRDEWFYQQRSSVSGHIPAGARLKAFQHMQRMMEAEGKLVRQPDGSYAAATPQAGPAVGGAWSSLGPTPTTGGFFSPVSGRVEAIAVDPSDPTGNTVLIGGAQGGIWRSTDGGNTWTPTGDSNPSLAMGSIAFAPSACNAFPASCTVYAGTGEQASIGFDVYYGAGVLKSTDHGQTWTQTCTTPSATCPFIGPFNNTVNFGFFNDGGARISYIAVNPANPNLVLVGAQIPSVGVSETAGGIYCSSDGGAHWSSLLSGEAGSFVGFANSTVAYAALGRPSGTATGAPTPNGIYRSANANASSCSAITFTLVTAPTTQSMGRIDLGIAPSDVTAKTVYASIADATTNSHANLGVFVTTNGGVSWLPTAALDICRLQCWYDNVIKVDPNNSSTVFFGGSAVRDSGGNPSWVVRTENGGTTWSSVIPNLPGGSAGLPHVDEHAMAFVKTGSTVRMYLGNDGGLWRTDDAEAPTVAWMNLNQNLTLTQFYPNLSVSPSNPTIAFGGAQDNGSQVFQGNSNWTDNRHCGDGGQTAVDFQTPTSVYVTCQLISLFFSPTGGTDPNSYVRIGSGINPNGTDSAAFIPPIATDPSTPGRVYFGTDHVYQSSDNGTTFTAISGVLPTRAGNYLTAFGVSPTNPAVVYAGANGGDIFVATNVSVGSASFSQVAGQSQHPFRNVTALVVDPHDQTGSTVYATFSGFAVSGQDTLGHVFLSTNSGATWTDVSCTNLGACQTPNASDLPNIPVNDLVVDPDLPGTIYAATDIGVFQRTCVGTACTWNTPGTSGLPNVAVLSLKLHEPSRTLIAGTHGRGAWSLVLTNFVFPPGPHITSLSPFFAPASASSPLTLTVDGSGLTGATAVQWKASTGTTALTPTPISDSQVTATVPVSLLTSGGTVQVSVSVGLANSNSLTFVVPSAAPTISSVSPTNTPVNVNSADILVTVMGTNFSSSSQVMLNPDFTPINFQPHGQVVIPTTFKSPTQLSATIPGSFITGYGSINSVGVRTLPPGGGITLSPPAGPTPLPTFTVVASPPTNDTIANAMPFSSLGGQLIVDSSAATASTGPILPCVTQQAGGSGKNGSYNTVWFSFTPSSNGTITDLSTQFSNYDTTLAVFTGTIGNLTMVPGACNDDINPGVVIQSDLQNIAVTGGTTYYIMVGAFGPPDPNPVALGGYCNVTLSFTQAPPDFTMTPVPTSVTVNAGSPATYTVAIGASNGFASSVNVTCSLPAAATTCTPNPPSVAPGNSTTITVTTMAHQLLIPARPLKRIGPWQRVVPLLVLATAVLILLFLAARTRRQRIAISIPLAGLFLFLVFQAAGCGSSNNGPPPQHGTQPGPYTVTITGTSGATTHTTTVMLTVN